MKFARIFSAGAGCSSVFYLALVLLIVVLVPHSRSQAPAQVSTSRPWPDGLGIHLGRSPRDACPVRLRAPEQRSYPISPINSNRKKLENRSKPKQNSDPDLVTLRSSR